MRLARLAAPATLALALLAAPLAAEAQQAGKVARIGILSPSPAYSGRVEAIRQGLQALGYVEGRNIAIEHRYATTEAEMLAQPARRATIIRLEGINARFRASITFAPYFLFYEEIDYR